MSTATVSDPGKPRRWSSAIPTAVSHALLIFCSCGLASGAAAESALQTWNRIKDKGSCEDFRRFVSDYGDTPLAPLARRKVKDCEREEEQALAEEWRRVKNRQARMTAQEQLEEEITEALQRDMIPAESQVRSWEEQVRRTPIGYLSRPYEDTLIALRSYHRCYKEYRSIGTQDRLPPACERLGFRAMPQPNRGRKVVRGDQAVALAVIRRYIGGTPVAADAGVGCDLFKTFTFLSEMTAKFRGRPPLSFKPVVRDNLKACGASINCISAETMDQIQPHKAWVWTAFADCRLEEARYNDAVENLEVAARHVRPDKEAELADLIVRHLQRVGDLARGAGARGFDDAGLRAKVGKKSRSVWLREALATGPRAPAPPPRPLTGPNSYGTTGVPPATPPRSSTPAPATAPPTAPPDYKWYASHWSQARDLTYYKALGSGDPDALGSTLIAVEQAQPMVLSLMRCWDQKELGSGAVIGSAAVQELADRLRGAERARLDRVALEVTASKARDDLRQELGFYPADFAVRQAIARRAIELGCPSIAAEQLRGIDDNHLNAVGPDAAELHRIVNGYVDRQAGSPDACGGQ